MIEFVKNFSNIFIELLTIMFLWSKFFFKETSILLKNLIIILISSAMVTYFSIININTALGYLIIILLVKFLYCKKLINIIFEFIILSVFVIIFELMGIFLVEKYTHVLYSEKFTIDIITNISIFFIIVMIYYLLFTTRIQYVKNVNSNILYYFSINIGIGLILSKLIWEYDENIILNNLLLYIICLVVIFIVQIYSYIYISKIIEEKKILEVQSEYISIIDSTIEEVKRKQHDFKNYINIINGIIEVTDGKQLKNELKEYIKSLTSSNKDIEDMLYIDNIIIKAVVYNKLCEAERFNINFSYNVNSNSLKNKFQDYEISDILSNLLNNAFEAVKNQDENIGNRNVILNIVIENDKSIIEVKNNGIPIKDEQINNIFKSGFSTKKGKNRGYGLYNVKRIVEGKGGKIQIAIDDNYTIFKIIF
ncbi:GHKL domain-containing protein [Clostridium sp.]|uniref:sensor histidine kinase n=1 Tax=Clostridium sp. TaxID=1506 RepID=UPI00258B0ED4|nr:GHKL domain-containing protein [Clostridium sp.]MDF2504698.1 putative histidine kinase [Clostridium sp.]